MADGAFENDLEALTQVRRLINFCLNREKPPVRESFDVVERTEPSLDTLVPTSAEKPYDMKELILKVVDESDFFEIAKDWAKNIVCGFGRIDGEPVSIVANLARRWPVLDIDAARKGAASFASATPSRSR